MKEIRIKLHAPLQLSKHSYKNNVFRIKKRDEVSFCLRIEGKGITNRHFVELHILLFF